MITPKDHHKNPVNATCHSGLEPEPRCRLIASGSRIKVRDNHEIFEIVRLWLSALFAAKKKATQWTLSLPALVLMWSLQTCSPDMTDDPIPFAAFEEIVLNLSLPENNDLNTLGYRYLGGSAGVRGIILYKKSATEYLAFERNCSYNPNSACATVDVHVSTFFMQDACCSSTFDWGGFPSGGPAWRPLRQYMTYLNGNLLTITDEIAN